MTTKTIHINGVIVPHHVLLRMMFASAPLSCTCLYGLALRGPRPYICGSIIWHISSNWHHFKLFIIKQSFGPYKTKPEYLGDMSNVDIYSTSCELMVVSKIFQYQLQVFCDGMLLARFGDPPEGVKRVKFSGDSMGDHFNAVLSPDEFLSSPIQ